MKHPPMTPAEFDDAKKLVAQVERGLKEYYEEAMPNSRCDKKGAGFNLDCRFKTGEALQIYVSSWTGYYGNSGCSTAISISNGKLFNTYLLRVLNKNFRMLMQQAVAELKDDLRQGLEAELARRRGEIDQIQAMLQPQTADVTPAMTADFNDMGL